MSPNRETGRALRRAQDVFHRNRRLVQQLLEKQDEEHYKVMHVTDTASQVRTYSWVHVGLDPQCQQSGRFSPEN